MALAGESRKDCVLSRKQGDGVRKSVLTVPLCDRPVPRPPELDQFTRILEPAQAQYDLVDQA